MCHEQPKMSLADWAAIATIVSVLVGWVAWLVRQLRKWFTRSHGGELRHAQPSPPEIVVIIVHVPADESGHAVATSDSRAHRLCRALRLR
jgi:hypothetical protein